MPGTCFFVSTGRGAGASAVVLECHRPLARLFAVLEGIDRVVVRGDAMPAVDCCASLLSLLAMLQASALVLNLLPVPGLDGYGVIRPFLPDGVQARMVKVERVGFLILFALIFWAPGVSTFIFGAALTITDLLGVSRPAIGEGWRTFHFWAS